MKNVAGVVLLLMLAGLYAVTAWACGSGTVRDAAFQGKRDLHRLCLFAARDDPAAAETAERLERWCDTEGKALNIKFERINADDVTIRWDDYGVPSAPPTLPAVALVGLFPSLRRAFVIDHWEPTVSDDDLKAIATSPAREAITDHIVDAWAVLLYSPQPKEAESSGNANHSGDFPEITGLPIGSMASQDSTKPLPIGRLAFPEKPVEQVLDAVAKRWAKEQPPGLSLVRFDRSDPRERILCSFIGLGASDPDWVGVVFGRGKLMAPPLRGDDITEDNLNQLLKSLAVPCTCLQESLAMGLDIPLKWDAALDARVTSIAPPQGYVEVTIGEQLAKLETQAPDEKQYVLATALVPLGAGAFVAVGAIALMVWRSRRRATVTGAMNAE